MTLIEPIAQSHSYIPFNQATDLQLNSIKASKWIRLPRERKPVLRRPTGLNLFEAQTQSTQAFREMGVDKWPILMLGTY